MGSGVLDHRDQPRTSVNNDPAFGRVPKSAFIASTNSSALSSTRAQEPIDAVASHRDAGRPFCNERLPLPLEDGP
jgi:hypothetical protein